MASRPTRLVVPVLLAVAAVVASSSPARQPPTGTAMYVTEHDPRLCPSPRCGGYWVTIANGVRTRCSDGARHLRCYVARAVDARGTPLARDVPEGALVRGSIDSWQLPGVERLDQLVVVGVYAPAGAAAPGGGYYRLVDKGIRCIRAPCFSYRAIQVNGSTRVPVSGVDLAVSRASLPEIARARTALRTREGLYARGRFSRTADGGTTFRALRLYLRAPQPRA